jgi:predicted O-linked N-acetylglucosamine transferase (SPINDLY family)
LNSVADLARAVKLWKGGQPAEAEREIQSVLHAAPEDPQALRFLAELYGATGRTGQAIPIWRRLCERTPQDAALLRQLAQVLLGQGALPEAIEKLRVAITLDPQNARAHNNLGLARLRSGDATAAVGCLETAVRLDPRYAFAYLNLGLAHEGLNQLTAARAAYEQALQIEPSLAHARARLSELLRRSDESAARRERHRALESHAINLMTVRKQDEAVQLWAQLLEEKSELGYELGTKFHCQLHCADWSEYAAMKASLEAGVLRGERVDLPFSFFVHSTSPSLQLTCSRTFIADRHPRVAGCSSPQWRASQRIHVAYVSADFHEHATAYLIAGLLEHHDRSRFEVTAISFGENDGSPMRARLERAADRFLDVRQRTDDEVVALLREAGVHIAVDLKGLTGAARTGIFARRAAPVQVNFLGYPGTVGADYIDYIIADGHVIPETDQAHYSEQVIYLPRCYQPNDPNRPRPSAAQAPDRAEFGLPASGFVFCCFNNLYKVTPAVFSVWMSLLHQVPGSVLWLLEGTRAGMINIRHAATAAGIDASRVIFAPHIDLADHLARYRHADLFLDTTPCNAHTTASDALWMAVPVLTVTGSTFAGRVATSLLHAVGLPQLCTRSLDEYAAAALRLAREPQELAALQAHLEAGRSSFPLFDIETYTKDLEAAYEEMGSRHRD